MKRKKLANEVWCSSPFYTHNGGYKFCLGVLPNGYNIGKGSHLSVSATLMRGEHDCELEWPVEGDIIVELLNWKEGKNHNLVQFLSTDTMILITKTLIVSLT